MYSLKGKTVMVAGGAGFVGSAIVAELLGRGVTVVCLDNYLHGVPENVQDLAGPLTVINGDILDPWQVINTIQTHRVDYLINCVGDTFVPTAYRKPQRFFDINLQGTMNILRAASHCGLERVVYVSSTEVYGEYLGEKVSEDAPLNPVNTYAVSKLAADRLCFTFYLEHKVPVVIARIFNCYGPRETHGYIVPEIISQLHRSNILNLGNLDAERDLTYVHDTARALIAVLVSDIPNGEVVNVGSDVSYSVKWLAQTLAERMGVSNLSIQVDPSRLRRVDIERFRCNNSKLKHYTDWSPQVNILDGFDLTIGWFRAHHNRWNWEASTLEAYAAETEESLSYP